MNVECGKCKRLYFVNRRFGIELLWRLVCPHCEDVVWICAPAQPEIDAKADALRNRKWSLAAPTV